MLQIVPAGGFIGKIIPVEGVRNGLPFPELRVQLHVNQGTSDRAVAEPHLDLEEIRPGLVVVKRVGMPKAVEGVTTAFPPELSDAVLENPGKSFLADVGSGLLPGEDPVIRTCLGTAVPAVFRHQRFQVRREFNPAGMAALADIFRDCKETILEAQVPEAEAYDFLKPQGTAIRKSERKPVLQVLRAEDKDSGVLPVRHFGKGMVNLAERKFIVCQGFLRTKRKNFLMAQL